MTLDLIKNTNLWQCSLSPQGDSSDIYREDFSKCLEKFRAQTETLVSFIKADMKDYRHEFDESVYFVTKPQQLLAQLTAILPINVYLKHNDKEEIVNLPNWKIISSEKIYDFIKNLEERSAELLEEEDDEEIDARFFNYAPVMMEEENIIGRVSLSPKTSRHSRSN